MELQRPERSARQIAALPPFGSAEREAHVRANGASYEPETLVYLLRESIDRADTALFNHLGHLLIGQIDGRECTGGQCERIIMSVAMSLGLHRDDDRLREYRAMVHASMWHAIHAGVQTKHFWEERFGLALKDTSLDIAARLARDGENQRVRAIRRTPDSTPCIVLRLDGDSAPLVEAVPNNGEVRYEFVVVR